MLQKRLTVYLVSFLVCFFINGAHGLVVLQYHHISDQTPKSTSVSPSLFKAHMDYLESQNFQVVEMASLVRWIQKGETLPDLTAVITFDDGYKSVFESAYPVLKEKKWPFTVFINTKAHDEKNRLFMSWDELRKLAKNGGTIANHTDSHPHMVRQQDYESFAQWENRREREIVFAQQRIEKEIGNTVKVFAYPFGEYDKRLQTRLKELGYLAFGQQSGPVAPYSHPQALPRFPFGGTYGDMEDFATKVLSMPFPQARVKVSGPDGKVLVDPELPANIGQPVLRIASPLLAYIRDANCFASGQGLIPSEIKGNVLVTSAKQNLPAGRSRYNCTVHAGGGRFYWYSQLFIRRKADGSWVNE